MLVNHDRTASRTPKHDLCPFRWESTIQRNVPVSCKQGAQNPGKGSNRPVRKDRGKSGIGKFGIGPYRRRDSACSLTQRSIRKLVAVRRNRRAIGKPIRRRKESLP
jgi:hypothetical protein